MRQGGWVTMSRLSKEDREKRLMGEDSGKKVRKEKESARERLEVIKPFKIERDLFVVHGWGDEANVCWTYPYTEQEGDCPLGWKYSFKEWAEEKILNHKERVHFVKLVKDEGNAQILFDRKKNVKEVTLGKDGIYDKTYFYVSFFQFAELLKEKIKEKKKTSKIDVLCHSMGGLDIVAAVAIDPEDDDKDVIVSPSLKCVNKLITVATPHRGSPMADLSNKEVVKLILGKNDYISKQGENMSPKFPFIQLINTLKIRRRVLERISELHIFGGGADIVVPTTHDYYRFDVSGLNKAIVKQKIKEYAPLALAAHSQVCGITQDPRLLYSVFEILAK